MRVKLVPPPPDGLEAVAAAQGALPLVPRAEDECRSAIADRLAIDRPEVARTWLTFLRGLGLVRRSRQGFARTGIEPDSATIAGGLRSGVFPAEELLAAIEAGPRSADAAFGSVADVVPPWERRRDPNWEERWREHVEHLLEWLVLTGLARRRDGGYARA